MENYIVGRNAVKEALRGDRSVQRLLVDEDKAQNALRDIVTIAKKQGIDVRLVPQKQLAKYADQVPHQGVVAFVNAISFKDLGQVLQESQDPAPLLILTDGVEDPHNMGAIIRTAECIGATAVLVPKRHNAPINATVAKTSAGAVELAHMEGDRTLYEADMTLPTVLVIGNEGKGISRLVKEACDFLVTIPMYGKLNSLNASVAAAILMYEAVRQRQVKSS